jgi:hypothetical protein
MNMADIKLIKFTSGEEIICELISAGTGAKVIKNGVTLVYHQTEKGTVSVGFSPYMPYSDGTIAIYDGSVQSITDVKKELLSEYNRIYGSGIVLAGANDSAFKAK